MMIAEKAADLILGRPPLPPEHRKVAEDRQERLSARGTAAAHPV